MHSHPPSTPFTLAIICLNEAENIERCIRSVPFADDIVVLDSGSTDATRSIAASLGARVFDEPWRGFRQQKQRAVELAKYDWILSLDADEALSDDAQAELERLRRSATLGDFAGYDFLRKSWNLGRWIKHGGWYPDRQLRFFDRRRASWQGGEQIHERVAATRVASLEAEILHWPFKDLHEQIATNNRYSGLGAVELHGRGKRFSLYRILTKPVSKFVETYFFKGGFRDGMAGYVIAVGAAYSVFLKYAKLWEIEQRASHTSKHEANRDG